MQAIHASQNSHNRLTKHNGIQILQGIRTAAEAALADGVPSVHLIVLKQHPSGIEGFKAMETIEPPTIHPPAPGMVLRICRWRQVFETSKSRGYKTLSWISCPVGFQSTGYQNLLDSFDEFEAAAVYGAWQLLCQLAAQTPKRGYLCGDRGEAYNVRRIGRMTGLSYRVFELLIPWALTVQWLEWAPADQDYEPVADEPESDEPRATEKQKPQPATAADMTIEASVRACGVQAAAKAVRTATANGWTPEQIAGTVRYFVEHKNAWAAYQLYERLTGPPKDPAADWPETTTEYRNAEKARARQKAADAAQLAERQRREQQARRATKPTGPGLAAKLAESLANSKAVKESA